MNASPAERRHQEHALRLTAPAARRFHRDDTSRPGAATSVDSMRRVIVAVVIGLVCAAGQASADDAAVRAALIAHVGPITSAVGVVDQCARFGGDSCLAPAGARLRQAALTARRAAGRATSGNESLCVKRALGRYRATLQTYAELGLALRRSRDEQARRIARGLAGLPPLSCATRPPAPGPSGEGAPAPEGWETIVDCADRWNVRLGRLAARV